VTTLFRFRSTVFLSLHSVKIGTIAYLIVPPLYRSTVLAGVRQNSKIQLLNWEIPPCKWKVLSGWNAPFLGNRAIISCTPAGTAESGWYNIITSLNRHLSAVKRHELLSPSTISHTKSLPWNSDLRHTLCSCLDTTFALTLMFSSLTYVLRC